MKNVFLTIVATICLTYLFMGLLLYALQRHFIYSPTNGAYTVHAESVSLDSGAETLKIWIINGQEDHAIVYFGGNVEDVSGNIDNFKSIFKDSAVYLVNYRGYSGSTGNPSEVGHYVDALNIYDFLESRHQSISVIGRSLGSGVATYLAANRDLEKLVLVTPFDSVEKVAKSKYPIYPISFMLKDKYDSHGRAERINASTLVIVAEHDEIIPSKNTNRLIDKLNRNRTVVSIIEQATHNSIDMDGVYSSLLADFFD